MIIIFLQSTALHLAAKFGHSDCLDALLRRAADACVRDEVGFRPHKTNMPKGLVNDYVTLIG